MDKDPYYQYSLWFCWLSVLSILLQMRNFISLWINFHDLQSKRLINQTSSCYQYHLWLWGTHLNRNPSLVFYYGINQGCNTIAEKKEGWKGSNEDDRVINNKTSLHFFLSVVIVFLFSSIGLNIIYYSYLLEYVPYWLSFFCLTVAYR